MFVLIFLPSQQYFCKKTTIHSGLRAKNSIYALLSSNLEGQRLSLKRVFQLYKFVNQNKNNIKIQTAQKVKKQQH
jgi:hypothetical protein